MHYLIGVILPFKYDGEKLNDAIAEILKPWDENAELVETTDDDGDTYRHNPNGKWDWWQLGGRWTGVWSDYDPAKDPLNHQTCWLCQGTGLRNDETGRACRVEHPDYTCNGCGRETKSGFMLKHASQWVKRPDLDVISIPALLAIKDRRLPYAIAAAPDVWLEKETWTGEKWVECPDWTAVATSALENRRDCWIAAVDIHS
jgi:hypothetical protein